MIRSRRCSRDCGRSWRAPSRSSPAGHSPTLDAIVGPPRYAGAGLHGLEWRLESGNTISSGSPVGASRIVRELRDRFGTDPRLVIEDKGAAVALHYRQAPERAEECIAAMREIVTGPEFELLRGHAVIEARPRGADKGAALRALAANPPFAGRAPVFVGDDVTDEDGFLVALDLGGYGVKVGAGPTAARYRIAAVEAVRGWLAASLAALDGRSEHMTKPASLDLGVTGNCIISALVDREARIVWSCLPRLDGDPVFHALIDDSSAADARGFWSVELGGFERSEQEYVANTAVLTTRLFSSNGSAVEVIDFCPRFERLGRMFRPQTLVRRVRTLAGTPRICIRLRPSFGYGSLRPEMTHGSNHIRYVSPDRVLRLTTDAPVSYVLSETPFLLENSVNFVLGADETLTDGAEQTARTFQEETETYWRQWTRRLAIPPEWQDAVIRAAITLKLCTFEETGAIVAAMTTSIPEAADSGRNWDYRYCWLRDAFFVVRALNSLSEVDTMEHYLRYLANIVGQAPDGHLQPVYGIALERKLEEREIASLAGYRGMRPVRVGNQAFEHLQHDVYGNVVLAAAQSFFDRRLLRPATAQDFVRLERVGEQAYRVYATADASMWELRTRERVHTSSALMCWAACDRLARIATHRELPERSRLWQDRAAEIRGAIEERAFDAARGSFMESFGGKDVEAGLLLMAEVGFLPPDDPRFAGTVAAIEKRLRRGRHLFRYAAADDFGMPTTAFNICTFWYIDALARLGRREEARELFGYMLESRNHVGLLSEDIGPDDGEHWGNYPQTYSLVGIINAATRLSRSWEAFS